MTIKTTVTFDKKQTMIQLDESSLIINLLETNHIPKKIEKKTIYFLLKDNLPIEVRLNEPIEAKDFNKIVTLSCKSEQELTQLKNDLLTYCHQKGLSLLSVAPDSTASDSTNPLSILFSSCLLILNTFGILDDSEKNSRQKPSKARHKWTKKVSTIDFHINTRESVATVRWVKRNQLLIKKGAVMMKNVPLNKDGTVGFSAKAGTQLRTENAQSFDNFITTDDIYLKSVNEMGLFLYFGGTNSWLELKDDDGTTLNDWTIV